jgi:hypothetical protein
MVAVHGKIPLCDVIMGDCLFVCGCAGEHCGFVKAWKKMEGKVADSKGLVALSLSKPAGGSWSTSCCSDGCNVHSLLPCSAARSIALAV